MAEYFVRKGRRLLGPYDVPRLAQLARLGRINRSTQVSSDQATWFPASDVSGVFPAIIEPGPEPGPDPEPTADVLVAPKANRSRGKRIGLAAISGLAVLTLAVVAQVASSSGGTISSPDDETAIAGAVGMVVCGELVTTMDGDEIERPLPPKKDGKNRGFYGSGFLISPDGYVLTNKHVVRDVRPFLESSSQLFKEHSEDEQKSIQKIRAILRVYIAGVAYPARVIGVSAKYDLAVLRIPIEDAPCFSLAAEAPSRNETVYAVGFPSGANIELTKTGAIEKFARTITATSITEYFSESDFTYTQTTGAVSRIEEKSGAGKVIQHTANINHGSSGGPLITDSAVVVGINTFGIESKDTEYAVSMDQLRKEIDALVGHAVWH